jgi:hypothetical protein
VKRPTVIRRSPSAATHAHFIPFLMYTALTSWKFASAIVAREYPEAASLLSRERDPDIERDVIAKRYTRSDVAEARLFATLAQPSPQLIGQLWLSEPDSDMIEKRVYVIARQAMCHDADKTILIGIDVYQKQLVMGQMEERDGHRTLWLADQGQPLREALLTLEKKTKEAALASYRPLLRSVLTWCWDHRVMLDCHGQTVPPTRKRVQRRIKSRCTSARSHEQPLRVSAMCTM